MENITTGTVVKAQVISRKLGKRWKRSETYTTRIRGWNHWSRGFTCTQTANGVTVDYVDASTMVSREFDNTSYINSIREYLISEGYEVVWTSRGKLFVCKKIGETK